MNATWWAVHRPMHVYFKFPAAKNEQNLMTSDKNITKIERKAMT